jgi:hypothetical protein
MRLPQQQLVSIALFAFFIDHATPCYVVHTALRQQLWCIMAVALFSAGVSPPTGMRLEDPFGTLFFQKEESNGLF